MPTKLSRRNFLKLCAGSAAAISLTGYLAPFMKEAVAAGAPKVIWLQGASCTGCSISLLNTVHPDIQKVLTEVISVTYHPNISAAAGELAMQEGILKIADSGEPFFLVVEGSVPTADEGRFCTVGEEGGKELTFEELVKRVGSKAAAILSFGTCSAFGGIPATPPNPTGCKPVSDIVKDVPVVNVPGCPPHPDWMVGTIAHVILYGIGELELDSFGRPTMFFNKIIHDNCERRQYFDNAIFAKTFGEMGCMLELGCKGPFAHCDASTRGFNNGANWCVRAGGVCIGCTEPQFPGWPMYERLPELPISPAMTATVDQIGEVLGGLAVVGIAGHLVGNIATGRIGPKKQEHEVEKEGEA